MNSEPIRVCSFESRRQIEMQKLIERFGGVATVAPSMREVPLESNSAAFEFANRLIKREIDIVVFLTGVGTDAFYEAVASQFSAEILTHALQNVLVAVRGPKPAAALSKRKITPHLRAPEPNTWRELVNQFQESGISVSGKRIAIQEYGVPSEELHQWFQQQGADVLPVPIYRWMLPEDLAPLESAIRSTIAGEFDLMLWTSAQQIVHVVEVAERLGLKESWLSASQKISHASIGPTASERLREYGVNPLLEPSHPKMAHLVREAMAAVRDCS